MATDFQTAALTSLPPYWVRALGSAPGFDDQIELTAGASKMMRELARGAQVDLALRMMFASGSLFEQALTQEPKGWTDASVRQMVTLRGTLIGDSLGVEDFVAPRLEMLKRIYRTGTGGFLGLEIKDPTGVSTWINTTQGSANVVANAIKNDPNPEVRIMLLKILSDVAVPGAWITAIKQSAALETLDSQLPRTQWSSDSGEDLAYRKTLQGLSDSAKGRIDSTLAQAATGALPNLADMPAVPPPPKPPYKRAELVWGAVAGLVGGVLWALTHPR